MNNQQTRRKPRLWLSALITLLITSSTIFASAGPAQAETGGYPYATYNGPGTNPAGSFWADSSGSGVSPYGYYYRNCTDYVAWKLQSLGVSDTKTRGLGNGGEWAVKANGRAGVTVNTVPAYGAAAVSTSGEFGHVAFVKSVNANGTITVSEYNWANPTPDGHYHEQTGTPAALGFTQFVHFADVEAPTTPGPSTPADFNQDGKSDIAWLTSSGTVNALLSTGTSFTTSGLAAGYANPTWAGVGNFNADDRGDIALYQASNQTLYLLKGDSSGTWSAGPVLTNLAEPAWAGVGDFNRDGLDDLAWYTSQNGGTITALLSTGTSFTSSVIATGYANPTWAGTGDFNGDGRGDIAWYQESNQTLYLLKADNAGQWSAGAVVTGLSKPKWAGTGDFTRDGKTDIAWYRSSGGTITILVATATSFNSSALVTGYAIPTWAGTGDYNGDGRDDIAWYQSNQTLYLLKANNAGIWAAGPVMTGLAPPIWAGNGSPPIS